MRRRWSLLWVGCALGAIPLSKAPSARASSDGQPGSVEGRRVHLAQAVARPSPGTGPSGNVPGDATPSATPQSTGAPPSVAPPIEATLDSFTRALQERLFERQSEDIERAALEAERALLEKQNDARLSLRGHVGGRLSPKEKGRELEDESRVALVPREFTPTQAHGVTLSKVLHDFGRLDAKRKALEARGALLPFDRARAEEEARWQAADLLLDLRSAGAIVRSIEPQLSNARIKRESLEREYRRGLRSEADRTRSEADVLRVELQLERARRTVRERAIAASARTGLDASRLEAAVLDAKAVAFEPRPASAWRGLLAGGTGAGGNVGTGNGADAGAGAGAAPLASAGVPAIELRRLEAERTVLRQELDATRSLETPTLTGEVGTQWPGEFLPLRGSLFATLTFAWEVPWNGQGALERDKLLVEARRIDLEDARIRRDAGVALAAAEPARDTLLRQLELLEAQRATLERLRALTNRRYSAGRATALELSTVEDDLLANAAETIRLQGDLALAVLDAARARGAFEITRTLLP